jgi:hypothetical protein
MGHDGWAMTGTHLTRYHPVTSRKLPGALRNLLPGFRSKAYAAPVIFSSTLGVLTNSSRRGARPASRPGICAHSGFTTPLPSARTLSTAPSRAGSTRNQRGCSTKPQLRLSAKDSRTQPLQKGATVAGFALSLFPPIFQRRRVRSPHRATVACGAGTLSSPLPKGWPCTARLFELFAPSPAPL